MLITICPVTAKGTRQIESWKRRGHAVDCWQDHERCALQSARDLMETRAAHVKAQARNFRDAVDGLDRVVPIPPDELLVEQAREVLAEYHASLRKRTNQ